MGKTKFKISIIALALTFLLALSALFAIHFVPAKAAGQVTVSGQNVFTATGDANVIAGQDKDDEDSFYTMFSFAFAGDAVTYRKNLAYYWMESADSVGLFHMEIGFKTTAFEKFVIKFESQEFNKTENGKSSNYVVFFPAEEGKVTAVVTDDADTVSAEDASEIAFDADHITIAFTEKLSGSYRVSVGNGEDAAVTGEFVNVGGNFAKASTTTSNPVYPLTFSAKFANEEDGDRDSAQMILYSLNGQSFQLTDVKGGDNDYYYGGTVTDDVAPVLCLTEDISYFELGQAIDIDYAVIDVLRTSPKATVSYYILTVDQYNDADLTDYNDTSLFTEIGTSDEYLLVSGSDKYFPASETSDSAVFGDKFTADMAVKVYLTLTDTTTNGADPVDVYLDWYVAEDYKINIQGYDFIAVAKDELGATFNYDGEDGRSWSDAKDGRIAAYQAQVNELAKNLSAGSSSYLYLPSAESLFIDNATSYADLTFSIYYYHNSKQSSTGLTSSDLSINITQQGAYTFTLYATDAAGNNMYYLDEDGEIVEFAASEIWTMFEDEDDKGLADLLPWFTFDVGYTGVAFEEVPGLQATAYVGTTYSSASFKINGISGSYETVYRLFLFDRAGYYEYTNGTTLSYEEFVAQMDELFNNPETRTFFREIPVASSLQETDEDYETFAPYEWTGTSTTFVPQDANAFYLIRAEVTDTQYVSDPITCNLGVVASVKASSIKGDSEWLKNNVASVVLLCVAGVALIGIIVLIVIKPKDKGDIDEQFESEKKKTKKIK